MTELMAIMVIIGILAAFVIPRFFDINVFQSRGTADQVNAALRYGQKIAIAQRRNVSVTITSASASSCGMTLIAGNVSCTISNSMAVTPPLPQTVTFSALGQPVPNVASSFTVGTTNIIIEAETGYVHQ